MSKGDRLKMEEILLGKNNYCGIWRNKNMCKYFYLENLYHNSYTIISYPALSIPISFTIEYYFCSDFMGIKMSSFHVFFDQDSDHQFSNIIDYTYWAYSVWEGTTPSMKARMRESRGAILEA